MKSGELSVCDVGDCALGRGFPTARETCSMLHRA